MINMTKSLFSKISKLPKFLQAILAITIILLFDPIYLAERYVFDREFYFWSNQTALSGSQIKNGYRVKDGRKCVETSRSYPVPIAFIGTEAFCMSSHSYCPIPGTEGESKYNEIKRIGLRTNKCGCPSNLSAESQSECIPDNLETQNFAEWRFVGFLFDFTKFL